MNILKVASQSVAGGAFLYTAYDVINSALSTGIVKVRTVKEFWAMQDKAGFAQFYSSLQSLTSSFFAKFIVDLYMPLFLLLVSLVIYAVYRIVLLVGGKDKTSRL